MNNLTGRIFNIQRFSTDDGNGIRTTVFLKGCALNCLWCHNPEGKSTKAEIAFYPEKCIGCGECTHACKNGAHVMGEHGHELCRDRCVACGKCVSHCPAGALALFGRDMTVNEVLREVERDRAYYLNGGGMTLSGGEPLYQPEFSTALLEAAHSSSINTCVETSGICSRAVLESILPYTDAFLFDIKETDAALHHKFTAAPLEKVLESLDFICSRSAAVTLRCPFIPELNDRDGHWRAVAALAEKYDSITAVQLMPYHPAGLSKAAAAGHEILYGRDTLADTYDVETAAELIRQHTTKHVVI